MVLGEHFGADPAELLSHAPTEIGVSHRRPAYWRPPAAYGRGVLLQADPTGLSGPLGQLVIAAMLLVAIIVALRWFWDRRNR